MTMAELEKRVAALEKTVAELRSQVGAEPKKEEPWWVKSAGLFANDPVFDEIVRLGREYRKSQVPDYMKKRKPKKKRSANARS